MLAYYELDLGLSHVVRKWSEPTDPRANTLEFQGQLAATGFFRSFRWSLECYSLLQGLRSLPLYGCTTLRSYPR